MTRTVAVGGAPGSGGPVTAVVVDLGGDLDLETAPLLRAQFAELAVAGHQHLILDLDRLEFCDSAGLSLLVAAQQRARARGGGLHLAGATAHLAKVLHATGLTTILPLHPSVAAALTTWPAPQQTSVSRHPG